MMKQYVKEAPDGCELTPGTLGGRLRLAGHNISMAQIIGTIANSDSAKLFASQYDLNEAEVIRAIENVSVWLDTIRKEEK